MTMTIEITTRPILTVMVHSDCMTNCAGTRQEVRVKISLVIPVGGVSFMTLLPEVENEPCGQEGVHDSAKPK